MNRLLFSSNIEHQVQNTYGACVGRRTAVTQAFKNFLNKFNFEANESTSLDKCLCMGGGGKDGCVGGWCGVAYSYMYIIIRRKKLVSRALKNLIRQEIHP